MAYILEFVDETDEYDNIFEVKGLKIIVDDKSLVYIDGTQLDFRKGLNEVFVFDNPNASGECGCGEFYCLINIIEYYELFKLFDIEQSFNVDLSTLQKKYFNLQNTFHPDKYSNASSRDKLLALQKTSEINDAYNVLKNPISRAEHLLNINGIDFDHNKTIADDTFLFEQMELRETMEEVSHNIENMHNKLEELSHMWKLIQQNSWKIK